MCVCGMYIPTYSSDRFFSPLAFPVNIQAEKSRSDQLQTRKGDSGQLILWEVEVFVGPRIMTPPVC